MGKGRNLGRVSVNESGEISVANLGAAPAPAAVLTPTNSSPANAATDIGETPTLSASTYYSLYGFTHAKSQWQVSTVSDFASTVVSTGDVDNLTSYTVSAGVLSTSTTYYWRVRYKDSNGSYSAYSTATTFTTAAGFSYSVEVLVVAGGGGGTRGTGSGGSGAGGYLEGSMTLAATTEYPVTIGAGGAAAPSQGTIGSVGSNSVFNGATALGGGVGARDSGTGLAGGSGGGAAGASINGSNRPNTAATQGNSGGLTGYGNTGGSATGNTWYIGSGGGGAGAVGENCPGSADVRGGTGGAGRQWVDGNYYAGGGGGGSESTAAIASPAVGGGGASGRNGTNPTSGTANTGGGAGGTGLSAQPAAQGGSGVVIIRYLGAQKGTGGTVTSSGGYTYHTFTTSGTYTS